MKDNETDYLNKLFTPDAPGEAEDDFPMLDVPPGLTAKLYAITASAPARAKPNKSWPKFASLAASVLMAVVLFQVYQQQQTLKQLEQAQIDLATALHYIGEANKITQAQMRHTLNTNIKKAAVAPALEVGRDAVLHTKESLEATTNIPSRTL